jgi:putative CocE/NonD family hydrolase
MVFETEPLQEPIEIVGPIAASLSASSSAKDTDFTAKLIDKYPPSDEFPNGFAMNLCDGIIRARFRNDRTKEELMNPGQIYTFEINLQATGNVFKKGHRIRLDISSSNFPQFDVNPNTGDPLWSSKKTISAEQTIYHDSKNVSFITLPVIKQDADR